MATPTGGNSFCEVVIQGRLHNQVTNNVLHFHAEAPSTIEQLIADVIDCIRTALLPGLSNEWKLEFVKAKELSPVLGIEVVVQALDTDIGGVASQSLPSTVAACISKRSNFGGKQNRGRMYIAGITESNQQNSRVIDPGLAALVNFCLCMAGKFIANPGTSPFKLVVISRRKLAAFNNNYMQAFVYVQNLIVQSVLATMRSRRIGHGS